MRIRPAEPQDREAIIDQIRHFRIALAKLRHRPPVCHRSTAEAELEDYLEKQFPIFVAMEEQAGVVGYMVCRVDEEVVWVESLFVDVAHRRAGIASQLYAAAEQLAQDLGGEAPYNWIDPDNDIIVQFLKKRGYHVLNLIELRKQRPGEKLVNKIKVGDQTYYRS